MRFLLDEGVPFRLATFLVTLGHDASAVGLDYPASLADRTILDIARREGRVIVTNDKDFGDLVVRDRLPHAGIILFRLGYVSIDVRTRLMRRVVEEHPADLGALIVVSHSGIRVHRVDRSE